MMAQEILTTLFIDEKIRLLSGSGSWFTYDCNGKLPSIMMSDGPHGLRKQDFEDYKDINKSKVATCFPTASALANSWDRDLVKKLSGAIADEALKEKIAVVLGCGVNIKRNPLCGRNFEYFSEDPFLTGELGVAYVKGMEEKGVGTSVKHFACNNQEKFRQTQNSIVDERTLHEIYLSAFEKIVKEAKPTTIMASYNRINGTYGCHNAYLLKDILREKWGYEGLVVSDWGAGVDMVQCVKNGLNLEMPDSVGIHTAQIKKAYEEGFLSEDDIDSAAIKVVEMVLSQSAKQKDIEIDYDTQHKIAVDIASECCVLLKNDDGILPLQKDANILIVGEMAQNIRYQGGGSSHINVKNLKNHVQCLQEKFTNADFTLGYTEDRIDTNLEKIAVQKAERAEYILFFGGLPEKYEGEGFDREHLDVPNNQEHLLESISKVNNNIIFISASGSPFVLKNSNLIKSFLHTYLGGEGVAEAVTRIVSGEQNPCGKLAETYPRSINDVPSSEWFAKDTHNVEYKEGLYVGYRYFDTYNVPTLYDFGYGLSYTKFEYSNLSVSEDGINVSFSLKNIGKFKGKEIAQVYVKNNDISLNRAKRELAGFTKVELEPGESKNVSLSLSKRSFSAYDIHTKEFQAIGGDYEIQVGASLNDILLHKAITIENNVEKTSILGKRYEAIREMCNATGKMLKDIGCKDFDTIKKGEYTIYHTLSDLRKTSLLVRAMAAGLTQSVLHMNKDLPKNDPALKMMELGLLEGTLDCIMVQSNGVLSPKIMDSVLLWANGHPLKAIGNLFSKDK